MRLLVLSNLYPPYYLGGYEILCAQVCRHLAERGHEVRVQASNHGLDEEASEDSTVDGVPVLRNLRLYLPFGKPTATLPFARRRTGRLNYERTAALLADYRPDLVFAWSQLRLTVGSLRACQDAGIPVVHTFNDANIYSYLPHRFTLAPRGFVGWLLTRTSLREITLAGIDLSRATCISRQLRNEMVEHGLPVEEAEIIYQGIPIEKFPAKENPGSLGSPARLLYVGQLHEYKGVHTLIEAVGLLVEQRGAGCVSLTIAGDGPAKYIERLRSLASECGAPVAFKGRVPHDEVPALYRAHDLFVFPSIWREPFGLTHLEAMASGLPVVSTTDGGHGEFLVNEENALTFRKEDGAHLAQCLARLLHDESLARRLADAGRRTVERDFTLSRYIDGLEAFLERMKEQAA
ncbi:MAG: glycogen synthase [Candidatus Sumerlaeota bacterium]|nr:glycogen synthase [Candidatus Sumerlaeota bacterium]